ncbi:MAG: transposase [Chloroflexota bacterium]|nr:transposase [Chloroflexota bacterium]
MADGSAPLVPVATVEPVPPPRRRRAVAALGLHAVQLVTGLGLLPLAGSVVGLALLSHRRLPAATRPRGRPRTYSDATILLLALLGRLWQLSTREVCAWLARWPALATACGLPPGRVIHPAHLSRRVRRLGPYPFWLLYLALVWRAIRCDLVSGRDVALDSTLLAAWTATDSDAAWSFPSAKGRVFGYKVHVLLDRAARLPVLFLLSPANRNDLPFAYPLLWLARGLLGLPLRVVRADGAYWGRALVRFIVAVLGARPIIPFNRKKQPLARVRHLAWYRLSYAARAVIERFFGVAKRHYRLDTADAVGWEPVLLRVTLTFCAILVVALAAHQAGAPELRLSPTRVLAHYLPVQEVA